MKRDYAESRLQAEIVKAFSIFGVYAMQVPNGEITDMSVKKYMRLVAMGFRSGAPDLLLFKKGENRFYCLELKKPATDKNSAGKQSEGQITFEDTCTRNNWPYTVVDTLDGAMKAAKDWGLIHA